ncbi:putative NADH dehydrogenase [ubiquinone] iron-sulfur protein 6, mitochondrial [Hypsibius exemplaris]|uniref:NADH dehydrogenase [ubiquinone] iron-sulfur protein 6, mitochondrial n=1 Tax=Hypsibius exemplaris TaxID=2072580 RepID=A0A9X6NIS3_HYPEX|nr:putative NADH dehydrogenase [ubiquinone] iron-sulfur protein 6, mitochondrial [Hypsibius exemplaris]
MFGRVALGTRARVVVPSIGGSVRGKSTSSAVATKSAPSSSSAVGPLAVPLHDADKIYLNNGKTGGELLDDVQTHTGQKWDKDDYRMVRFVNFPKLVNQRRAMDLINDIPPVPVPGSRTFCDGGGGPLGHPKVFINVDKPGNHACGYCGIRFYKDDHHHH